MSFAAFEFVHLVHQELKKRSVNLVGHVHDGDRRVVNAGLYLTWPPVPPVSEIGQVVGGRGRKRKASGNNATATATASVGVSPATSTSRPNDIRVNHPIIQLIIKNVSNDNVPMFIGDSVDWLHTGWRIRQVIW
jgi:hypothetical protein